MAAASAASAADVMAEMASFFSFFPPLTLGECFENIPGAYNVLFNQTAKVIHVQSQSLIFTAPLSHTKLQQCSSSLSTGQTGQIWVCDPSSSLCLSLHKTSALNRLEKKKINQSINLRGVHKIANNTFLISSRYLTRWSSAAPNDITFPQTTLINTIRTVLNNSLAHDLILLYCTTRGHKSPWNIIACIIFGEVTFCFFNSHTKFTSFLWLVRLFTRLVKQKGCSYFRLGADQRLICNRTSNPPAPFIPPSPPSTTSPLACVYTSLRATLPLSPSLFALSIFSTCCFVFVFFVCSEINSNNAGI